MKKITFKTQVITPTMSKEYLKKNTNNRTVSKGRVTYYAGEMKKGNWNILSPEGISFDEYGRLLDGQHRLMAIIESGVSVQMVVTEGYDKEVFSKINRGKTRNTTDDFGILGIPNANIVSPGISAYLKLSKSNSDIASMNTRYDKAQYSSDDKCTEYFEDSDFYDEMAIISQKMYNKNGLKLFKIGEYFSIMCYLIKDKKHSQETVVRFFTELNTNSEFSNVNTLKFKIMQMKQNKSSRMDNTYKMKMLIKVWNDWVSGKNPTSIYIHTDREYKFI